MDASRLPTQRAGSEILESIKCVWALFANPRRNTIALLLIGLAFHIGLWVLSGGYLSSKLGDDDSAYVFLALETMGLMDEPPLFDVRPPGWPLTIAAVLAVVGVKNMWALGLVMRVALSFWPLLAYQVLRLHVCEESAFVLSLLILLLPINRHRAETAYSDVFYATAILLGVTLFLLALRHRLHWPWVGATGVVLAYMVLLRPEALIILLALLVIFLFCDREQIPLKHFLMALLLMLPTLVGVGAWGTYNRGQLGSFALANLGGACLSPEFAVHARSVPESEEIAQVSELLPEVTDGQHVLLHWHDYWVGRYRAGQGFGVKRFDRLVSQIGFQRVLANPGIYAIWVAENGLYALLFPVPPPTWLPDKSEDRDYPETHFGEDGSIGRMQLSFGSRVKRTSDERFRELWEGARFSLAERLLFSRKVWTVIDPIFFLSLPLWMGSIGAVAMVVLLARQSTRSLGLTLLIFCFSAHIGLLLLANSQLRYLYFTHSILFLAAMTVFGMLVESWIRRRVLATVP